MMIVPRNIKRPGSEREHAFYDTLKLAIPRQICSVAGVPSRQEIVTARISLNPGRTRGHKTAPTVDLPARAPRG